MRPCCGTSTTSYSTRDPNGLQVVPGLHRYLMPVNWKLLAENFGGDQYHFAATHGSVAALSNAGQTARINFSIDEGQHYSVVLDGCAPHGLLQLAIGDNFYQDDLAQAETLGTEAVEWLTERQRRQNERLGDIPCAALQFSCRQYLPELQHDRHGHGLLWPGIHYVAASGAAVD